MTIVYEYEVINEDLVCMITNALGVFDDHEIAKEFLTVISRIEQIIYTQKFTGAAAGLLQANIISMELGLNIKLR